MISQAPVQQMRIITILHKHTHTNIYKYKNTHIQTHKCWSFYSKVNKGNTLLENIEPEINKGLPEDKNMQLVYTWRRLITIFNIKDKTKEDRHYNLTYSVKSSMKNYPEPYNGETGR